MKIRVQHTDGTMETLTLVPPIGIEYGKSLHRIHSACGLEHWFTEEGYYDGWGCATNLQNPVDANRVIERIEDSREIDED